VEKRRAQSKEKLGLLPRVSEQVPAWGILALSSHVTKEVTFVFFMVIWPTSLASSGIDKLTPLPFFLPNSLKEAFLDSHLAL